MRSRPLAGDEGEVVAEFEHEVFKMMHEGIFQLGLRVFVLQAKEFEHERIFDFLVDRERVFKAGSGSLTKHFRFVFRESRAFVELAIHLPPKLANGPPAAYRFRLVEGECLGRAGMADQLNVMRPWQRKNASEVGQGGRFLFSSLFSFLFKLHDAPPDLPIGGCHDRIHGPRRGSTRRFQQFHHSGKNNIVALEAVGFGYGLAFHELRT